MALDERLNKVARIGHNLTQPVPGARGGEGGDEGGGTAETVISSGPVGSRKLTPNEQGHTKPFVLASGTTLDDMTGYVYHGIRVDNFTPQFMRVHGLIDAYIPPNTYGVQIPVMMGSQKCWVTWEAPVGYTQPAAAVTQSAIIYFTEALISPSAGIDINGLAVGAADLRINIDQWAGFSVSGASAWTGDNVTEALFGATPGVAAMIRLHNGSSADRLQSMGGAGDGLGVALASQPSTAGLNSSTPAVNTAATLTFTGVAGQKHRLTYLSYSYNAAPTGGTIQVQDNVTPVIIVDIPASGEKFVQLPPGGISGSVNTNMVITLAAAGAAVTGKVSAAKLTT